MVVLRKHGGDGDGGGDGDDNVDGVQTNWETQLSLSYFARNHCGLRSQLRSSMSDSVSSVCEWVSGGLFPWLG